MIQNQEDTAKQNSWYKDAVIYELHIKAFKDGNGDGIGDFEGILEKLDYIQELGVTAIWVLPFYPSPLKDDGYDIADYYSINPSYGNIDHFKEFLKEAHRRNLKVITELVINHTSDQHPWFQRSRIAPKGSPEREFYVWSDDPNKYKDVRIIFQDFEASNWTWDPVAQQYYWHRFFHHQPDLNYDNPLVQEEVFKIIDYWCSLGVDGFRLDAVPYLFEREGTNGENLPETHSFLKKLRKHIDEKFPNTMFLAEANMWPEDSAAYFGNGDECHMNYHFPVMPRMFMAVQREDRYPITDIFEQTPDIPDNCQWAMFLRNHDELTLEMVTDEERDYMYKVYAKDPKARINLGIRHRLAPLMENNRRKIELMNSLLFSMPGTPVIYYGDEIGMGDNFYLGDRDGVRTPMQWSPDRNAGFSSANPHQLYLPVILDPEYNYEAVNVETQRRNTSSLFWFMKRLINLRKKYVAFGRGDMKFINGDNPKILAFTRTYKDQTLLIIANLSKYWQPAELFLNEFKGYTPVEIFSKNKFPVIKESVPYFFTLSPHSFQWFQLQPINQSSENTESLPTFTINVDSDLLIEQFKETLESEILPSYLKRSKWFKGRGRDVYNCVITDHSKIRLENSYAYILIVEVNYNTGLPETYSVPVTMATEDTFKILQETFPEVLLAKIINEEKAFYLCDAIYTIDFRNYIINQLAGNVKTNAIEFNGKSTIKSFLADKGEILSRIHPGDENNTSINYENTFFVKFYRKIEKGLNPDIEITRNLSDKLQFDYVPAYLGQINWCKNKDYYALAIVQPLIENHGDGKMFMQERVHNYLERILASDRSMIDPLIRHGKLTSPVSYETLPEQIRTLLGNSAADQSRLLGIRTAELHIALATNSIEKDFKPEPFSLHYQRSLFSSIVSLLRETAQTIEHALPKLSGDLKDEVFEIIERKKGILDSFKQIYAKKFDALKIRIHGSYHLRKILITGKDLCIQDFGGDPYRTFGERRLKRSPLRDVAFMIRSFYYAAYDTFINSHISKEELNALLPFAWFWAYHMSGFFLKAYIDKMKGHGIVPENEEDLSVMIHTFLLERAFYALNYELINRPDHIVVPIQIIHSILNYSTSKETDETKVKFENQIG